DANLRLRVLQRLNERGGGRIRIGCADVSEELGGPKADVGILLLERGRQAWDCSLLSPRVQLPQNVCLLQRSGGGEPDVRLRVAEQLHQHERGGLLLGGSCSGKGLGGREADARLGLPEQLQQYGQGVLLLGGAALPQRLRCP